MEILLNNYLQEVEYSFLKQKQDGLILRMKELKYYLKDILRLRVHINYPKNCTTFMKIIQIKTQQEPNLLTGIKEVEELDFKAFNTAANSIFNHYDYHP